MLARALFPVLFVITTATWSVADDSLLTAAENGDVARRKRSWSGGPTLTKPSRTDDGAPLGGPPGRLVARAAVAEGGSPGGSETRYGLRPLILACQSGAADVVSLLLDAGADPNAALAGGETPLMMAARTGSVESIRMLIAKGATVNATERKGQTALMWAAAEGNAEAVSELLKGGADPAISLGSGFNAFFLRCSRGTPEYCPPISRRGRERQPGPASPEQGSEEVHDGLDPGRGEWPF